MHDVDMNSYGDMRFTFSVCTKQEGVFTEPLFRNLQPSRTAELEDKVKRLVDMVRKASSDMRRCENQFRDEQFGVEWEDAADDCKSDADFYDSLLAEIGGGV